MIVANKDGMGHGNTVDALSLAGKIKPVTIKFSDGTSLKANSCWAATDYLKAAGFYGPKAAELPTYQII